MQNSEKWHSMMCSASNFDFLRERNFFLENNCMTGVFQESRRRKLKNVILHERIFCFDKDGMLL